MIEPIEARAHGSFSVGGMVTIVTGASSGIGHALSISLAEAGAVVVASARSHPDFEGTAAESATVIPADVTSPTGRHQLVEGTMAAFGRIDVLINCAGASVSGTAAEEDP